MNRTKELFEYDQSLLKKNIARHCIGIDAKGTVGTDAVGLLAGCDEAGRGPLAGPLVCAACVMPLNSLEDMIDGIDDSKKLSEKKRESLYAQILKKAISYKVSIIDNKTIDNINILNATKKGMTEAVMGLSKVDFALIDAVKLNLPIKTESLIKGDTLSYNIAAASILAKVTRDAIMRDYDNEYPDYGFKNNKGYGTAVHINNLIKNGACGIHRKTFIKNVFAKTDDE